MNVSNLKIILVEPSHPGNIGAAARAMKTMALTDLVIVNPKLFPDKKAWELAVGADDVLDRASVVPDLETAIADCQLVIATSARSRTLPLPALTPKETGEKLVAESSHYPVALLFGRERTGLYNEELQHAHFHVTIPTNPDFSALNLAAAVQVLCYEIHLASLSDSPPEETAAVDYATQAQADYFYAHLESTLRAMRFFNPNHEASVMARLKRLFQRARLETLEVNLLRGILTHMDKLLGGKNA